MEYLHRLHTDGEWEALPLVKPQAGSGKLPGEEEASDTEVAGQDLCAGFVRMQVGLLPGSLLLPLWLHDVLKDYDGKDYDADFALNRNGGIGSCPYTSQCTMTARLWMQSTIVILLELIFLAPEAIRERPFQGLELPLAWLWALAASLCHSRNAWHSVAVTIGHTMLCLTHILQHHIKTCTLKQAGQLQFQLLMHLTNRLISFAAWHPLRHADPAPHSICAGQHASGRQLLLAAGHTAPTCSGRPRLQSADHCHAKAHRITHDSFGRAWASRFLWFGSCCKAWGRPCCSAAVCADESDRKSSQQSPVVPR